MVAQGVARGRSRSTMRVVRIDHTTEYEFGEEVRILAHRLLLRPRESHSIRIASSRLEVSPLPTIRWRRDAYDNSVALLQFGARARRLYIASTVELESYEDAPLDFVVDDYAVNYPFFYAPGDHTALASLLGMRWPQQRAAVQSWLASIGLPGTRGQTFTLLDALNRSIAAGFRYVRRDTEGVQSPAQTLALRSGSCRDFATLFMEASHCLGLGARFVSGYRVLPSGDPFGSTHAWVEVYVPGPGWKGFDPTSGELTGREHIPVAVAGDPESVSPVTGSFEGSSGLRPAMRISVQCR